MRPNSFQPELFQSYEAVHFGLSSCLVHGSRRPPSWRMRQSECTLYEIWIEASNYEFLETLGCRKIEYRNEPPKHNFINRSKTIRIHFCQRKVCEYNPSEWKLRVQELTKPRSSHSTSWIVSDATENQELGESAGGKIGRIWWVREHFDTWKGQLSPSDLWGVFPCVDLQQQRRSSIRHCRQHFLQLLK